MNWNFSRVLMTTLILVGTVMNGTLALAQGTLHFATDQNTILRLTGDYNGAPLPPYGGYVQLFWAPGGTPITQWNTEEPRVTASQWLRENPAWKFFGNPLGMTDYGRFDAGILTIPTQTPGAAIEAMVVAWQGNFDSLESAFAAHTYIGTSAPFPVQTGTTPETAGNLPNLGEIWMWQTVPEPSGISLVACGVALWAIRKRIP